MGWFSSKRTSRDKKIAQPEASPGVEYRDVHVNEVVPVDEFRWHAVDLTSLAPAPTVSGGAAGVVNCMGGGGGNGYISWYRDPEMYSRNFGNEHGTVLSIKHDGRIETGPGMKMDDVAIELRKCLNLQYVRVRKMQRVRSGITHLLDDATLPNRVVTQLLYLREIIDGDE